jgi:hypothetical protein
MPHASPITPKHRADALTQADIFYFRRERVVQTTLVDVAPRRITTDRDDP